MVPERLDGHIDQLASKPCLLGSDVIFGSPYSFQIKVALYAWNRGY